MKKSKKEGHGKKGLVQRLLGSVLFDTWKQVRGKKTMLFITMVIDALFVISLFILNIFMKKIVPDAQGFGLNAGMSVLFVIFVLAIYYSIAVSLYSVSRFMIFHRVKRFFAKSKTDFSRFKDFLFADYMLVAVYLVALVLISLALIISIQVKLLIAVRNVFIAVIGTLFYLTMNAAHSLYLQKAVPARKLFRMAPGSVFNRLRIYMPLILFTVVAFFLLAGAYYSFDWVILKILGPAVKEPVVYWGYAVVNTIVFAVFGLGLLAFNRVYLYNILQKVR